MSHDVLVYAIAFSATLDGSVAAGYRKWTTPACPKDAAGAGPGFLWQMALVAYVFGKTEGFNTQIPYIHVDFIPPAHRGRNNVACLVLHRK